MSDLTTIARPYAKAIFELALDSKQLTAWSEALSVFAQIMLRPEVKQFISNPSVTADDQVNLLISIAGKLPLDPKWIKASLSLLADNKRLQCIPEIAIQYAYLRAEHEKTLVAHVKSFTPLSDEQQKRLMQQLSTRLQRRIELEISIDDSLLGGALIQAGDLVIDGSVRGQLEKLASTLAEQ